MDQAVIELIKTLKELSPAVWQAALTQVRVNAISHAIVSILLFTMAIICLIGEKQLKKPSDKYSFDDINGVGYICSFVFFVFFTVFFILSLQNWLSPDWQAIRLILDQVK